MNILNIFKRNKIEVIKRPAPESMGRHLFSVSFDGEKNLGEIGPIKHYKPDYEALRLRSWQAYLESEIAQTVIGKYVTWVIGSGLKLQAEPNKRVLKLEGINLDSEEFNETTEARFTVYAKSKKASYSGMHNIHELASKCFLNSINGGDILVILRYIDNTVKVQLVDGSHVASPTSSTYLEAARQRGNTIRDGIELSQNGEHVAYYVKKGLFDFEKIEAKNKAGLKTSFLVYGLEYRLDNVRGIPLVSAVLEKLKKMERYSEATLGSAEERQKIAYFIEHQLGSTGESPLAAQLAKAFNSDAITDDIPTDNEGKKLANTIAATTNKMAFNMPVNSTIKSLEGKNELYFKDFYTVNIDIVCATLGIPPNVAMSKYDSNFSASRAALKDWEHTLNVKRNSFGLNFYQPIYDFWMYSEILKNKIQAPGFLQVFSEGNYMVVEAYMNARFVGASVPHIDPEKEVRAERLKLGITADAIPLTTVEAATELLNGGDSDSNIQQYAKEFEEAKKLKIIQEQKPLNP